MASLRERCRATAREATRPYRHGNPRDLVESAADAAMRVTVEACAAVVAQSVGDGRRAIAACLRALLDEEDETR